jgi:hypothetical protein
MHDDGAMIAAHAAPAKYERYAGRGRVDVYAWRAGAFGRARRGGGYSAPGLAGSAVRRRT